ncbi:hypothetical protein Hanom_Chr06g00495931 [Helianthus anomalus]
MLSRRTLRCRFAPPFPNPLPPFPRPDIVVEMKMRLRFDLKDLGDDEYVWCCGFLYMLV